MNAASHGPGAARPGSISAAYAQCAASNSNKGSKSRAHKRTCVGFVAVVTTCGGGKRAIPAGCSRGSTGKKVSHNHPEAIRGAQAIALATYFARTEKNKDAIRARIADRFAYDLDRTVDEIRPDYSWDASCQGSVPESIICFLDGTDFESTIRNAVSLGGDTDTMACMAAGIAQAFYNGVADEIARAVEDRLPQEFSQVVARFNQKYGGH